MTKPGTITGGKKTIGITKRSSGRPVDASTLILVDASDGQPRVLMGRRRMDLAFMPGKFVFPGGRVDKADRAITPCKDLQAGETLKLLADMKGTPSEARARAIALAAIRETYEEAGLLIGERTADTAANSQTNAEANLVGAASNEAKQSADEPSTWSQFCAHGYQPGLDKLTFFARAITPPGRTRRFDTRFFCADVSAVCHRTDLRDDELSALQWLTLEETTDFDLPSITRVILEDLSERLNDGTLSHKDRPVPYYYFLNGSFRRELIRSEEN